MTLPAITISSDVMARQVGDETVLLHLASGSYYGLDPVGARVWQLLSDGRTPQQACEQLLQEFEVTADVLEVDLQRLIGELLAHGLVAPA